MLYPLLSQMTHRIARILLALNHCYLPDPSLKWLDRMITPLAISPMKLSDRLQTLYRLELVAAVSEVQQLFEETLDLVDSRLASVETTFARRWYRHRHVQWDQPPDGIAESSAGSRTQDTA